MIEQLQSIVTELAGIPAGATGQGRARDRAAKSAVPLGLRVEPDEVPACHEVPFFCGAFGSSAFAVRVCHGVEAPG